MMQDEESTSNPPIGDEEERLANLYVASWNLHSSLDLKEVVTTIFEICLNLVGADRTLFYVYDEEKGALEAVASNGGNLPTDRITLGEGLIGKAVTAGAPYVDSEGNTPLVVVPLTASERPVGAVVIEQLLEQKGSLSTLDLEIFDLLGRQGGLALYGAFLAGNTERKVTAGEFRSRLEG